MIAHEYHTPCRYCDDGETAWDEIATQCPECGWHTCSEPVGWLHEYHTCPECGHQW